MRNTERIALTEVITRNLQDARISTIKTADNAFETIIWWNDCEVFMKNYASLDAAKFGHACAVRIARNSKIIHGEMFCI